MQKLEQKPDPKIPRFLLALALQEHGISHCITLEEWRWREQASPKLSKDELHFMTLIKPKYRQKLNKLIRL